MYRVLQELVLKPGSELASLHFDSLFKGLFVVVFFNVFFLVRCLKQGVWLTQT